MNTVIFNFFFSLSSNPTIADLSLFLSNIFIYILIIIAILIPVFIRRDFFYSIIVFSTGIFSWVFVYIIKNIFMVPRPFITLHLTPLFMETGFSFPSSHVTIISAISILVYSINRKLGIVFFIFTILIGFSRMIIGVHYPLDVIAGACFGILIGLGILRFYQKAHRFAFSSKKL